MDNVVILTDQDGNDVEFEFLDLIECENENYVVLLPISEYEDNSEVFILKIIVTEDDIEYYETLDDEDTLEKIFSIFKDKFKEEFNFTEECDPLSIYDFLDNVE